LSQDCIAQLGVLACTFMSAVLPQLQLPQQLLSPPLLYTYTNLPSPWPLLELCAAAHSK